MRDFLLNATGIIGFVALVGGLCLWDVAAALVVGGSLMLTASVYGVKAGK